MDTKKYIDSHRERFFNELFSLLRIPSISALPEHRKDMQLCAERWRDLLLEAGADRAEVMPTSASPVVFAEKIVDRSFPTVLVYAHYDVMPEGDLKLWETPPFEPSVRNGKLYGRGSADNKSPLMAHLEAFEFLQKEVGELPINVLFLFEGCEESGSLGLPEFLKAHREEWKADLVFFSDGPKNETNLPIIALGAKGQVSIDLTLCTMKKDAHSRFAPVLPSAAWEMVELLGKMKTGDYVNVEGFYDGIVPPSEKELKF